MMEMVENGAWHNIGNGTEKVHNLAHKGAVCPDDNKLQENLDKGSQSSGNGSQEKAAKKGRHIGNLKFHVGRCKGQGKFKTHEKKG